MKQISAILLSSIIFVCGCARTEFSAAPAAERTAEIGLLLRKQFTSDINKSRPYRHVHTVLADGLVVGFNTQAYGNAFWQNILFKSGGEVQTTPELRLVRRHYVYVDVARNVTYKGEKNQKMVTDWVKFKVTPEQAAALAHEWQRLADDPPPFRLCGMNCATRAYQCLQRAGILPGGIPGIDRPENMMKPLRRYYPDLTLIRGYFGVDAQDKPFIEPLAQ